MVAEPVHGGRVRILPLGADALEALAARDAGRFRTLTGLAITGNGRPPPLMEDALPFVVEQLRSDPNAAPWWMWAIALGEEFVGSIGFGGRPDADGIVQVGYAVYPERQGEGIATEALRAMTVWAFAQPGVRRIQAMIPPWNAPSIRVAEHAGFTRCGSAQDDEVGEVHVYQYDPA
jgi:ribosomal-protein-alanine N-acetyltransferase